ncbi:MAG: RNA methyltransferase [Desulfuromonas thiophila]|nr:RNA methyltransferase [Desulfuromonas thiophila]
MKKTSEHCFVICPPGVERLCARELESLGIHVLAQETGGLSFDGNLQQIYRANLWLRSANRILVRLGTLQARDFPSLYRKASQLPWGKFLRSSAQLEVQVSAHHSRLNHSGRIAETLLAACDRALGSVTGNAAATNPQQLFVRFEQDQCTLSIDSSGERLHRRGYRHCPSQAPLRENLAAACLLQLGWDGKVPFMDAFCGSGTLVIEAALLASRRAPGLQRPFAFMGWPGYRAGLWQVLCDEARQQQIVPVVTLYAGDLDAPSLERAQANAARAGVADWINWQQGDFTTLLPTESEGLWLSNPPYGLRLERASHLPALLSRLRQHQQARLPGWQAVVLLPRQLLAKQRPRLAFRHGGLAVGLYPFSALP